MREEGKAIKCEGKREGRSTDTRKKMYKKSRRTARDKKESRSMSKRINAQGVREVHRRNRGEYVIDKRKKHMHNGRN